MIDRYGADALRWYFFTSKQPWDGYRFSLETIGEAVRQFLLQLWNTYGFYVLYANANGVAPSADLTVATDDLDRWVASRLQATVAIVRERMDDFDATSAGRAIAGFRRRALQLVRAALAPPLLGRRSGGVHHAAHCLLTVAQLLAPFCPFLADEIYDNLDGGEPSVHLTRLPEPPAPATRARGGDGRGARDGAARPGRPRAGQDQDPPAAARGGGRRHRRASARRSSGSPTSSARS